MVLPFHLLINDGDQRAVLTTLECGLVRYIVATICANVGIDMTVTNVVCVDIPDSYGQVERAVMGVGGCWSYMQVKT